MAAKDDQLALETIADAYNEWCDNGSRVMDGGATLETIGQILDENGYLDAEEEEDEEDFEEVA